MPLQALDEAQDFGTLRGRCSGIREAVAELHVGAQITRLGSAEFLELMDELQTLFVEQGLGGVVVDDNRLRG